VSHKLGEYGQACDEETGGNFRHRPDAVLRDIVRFIRLVGGKDDTIVDLNAST
jgi:hypothetical protein